MRKGEVKANLLCNNSCKCTREEAAVCKGLSARLLDEVAEPVGEVGGGGGAGKGLQRLVEGSQVLDGLH